MHKHAQRLYIGDTDGNFLSYSTEAMIMIWRQLNNALSLQIPNEEISAIPTPESLLPDEATNKAITAPIYSMGTLQDTLEFSILLIERFFEKIGKSPKVWIPKKLNSFCFDEKIARKYPKGFSWVSIQHINHGMKTAATLSEWIARQNTYCAPTFEPIQAIVLFPELIKYINTILGPSIGLLGLKNFCSDIRGLSVVSRPSFGVLTTNQFSDPQKLSRIQIIDFPEDTSFTQQYVNCPIIRYVHPR